jgi:hypothetical protein
VLVQITLESRIELPGKRGLVVSIPVSWDELARLVSLTITRISPSPHVPSARVFECSVTFCAFSLFIFRFFSMFAGCHVAIQNIWVFLQLLASPI